MTYDRTAEPPTERRICLGFDVERYTRFPGSSQAELQEKVLNLLCRALYDSGVDPAECAIQDRGDGCLVVLPAGINEGAVLPQLLMHLRDQLRQANTWLAGKAPLEQQGRLRMRVAISQGAVRQSAMGWVGRAAERTGDRLLNCDELKQALRDSPDSDFVAILGDDLYHDWVDLAYGGLAPKDFYRVQVHVPAKNFNERAWIYVDGARSKAAGTALFLVGAGFGAVSVPYLPDMAHWLHDEIFGHADHTDPVPAGHSADDHHDHLEDPHLATMHDTTDPLTHETHDTHGYDWEHHDPFDPTAQQPAHGWADTSHGADPFHGDHPADTDHGLHLDLDHHADHSVLDVDHHTHDQLLDLDHHTDDHHPF